MMANPSFRRWNAGTDAGTMDLLLLLLLFHGTMEWTLERWNDGMIIIIVVVVVDKLSEYSREFAWSSMISFDD
jgi:hypothetical protein